MASINKVILVGRIGQTPQERYTKSGKRVTSFSLATSNGRDKDPSWHSVECWQMPDFVHIDKGSLVMVEGRLAYEKWTDKSGTKRTTAKVIGNVYDLSPKTDKPQTKDDIPF